MSQGSENKLHSLAIQVLTVLMVQIFRPKKENAHCAHLSVF
jgi:hypothetical protein